MHPFCDGRLEDSGMQDLLLEISRRYTGKCFGKFMELGIYPGQLPILGILRERDGYSQRELAEHMHVKPPTVTVTIQRLEKSGMVKRRQDEKDQRMSRIYLTDKGRETIERAMEAVREHEKILFGGFSDTEQCLMRRFFLQIIENIEQIPCSTVREHLRKEELDKC